MNHPVRCAPLLPHLPLCRGFFFLSFLVFGRDNLSFLFKTVARSFPPCGRNFPSPQSSQIPAPETVRGFFGLRMSLFLDPFLGPLEASQLPLLRSTPPLFRLPETVLLRNEIDFGRFWDSRPVPRLPFFRLILGPSVQKGGDSTNSFFPPTTCQFFPPFITVWSKKLSVLLPTSLFFSPLFFTQIVRMRFFFFLFCQSFSFFF